MQSEVTILRRRLRVARRLLRSAEEALPNFIDGRNEKLSDAIIKWLETPDTLKEENKPRGQL